MGTVEIIAPTMGVGWASGINLYAAVATLGLLGASGNIELPVTMRVVQEPIVIGAAALMYGVEFFADKIPGVDTTWDAIHSFIRIPAGAVLAAAAVGELSPAAELAAALIGGVWAALHQPWLFLVFLALFVAAAIWILPKIGRGLRSAYRSLRGRGVTSS